MGEELSKRDKLAIAGYAAPRLRSARARPIKAVDADGNVVREISSVEMAEKVLQRVGIELEIEIANRPNNRKCKDCGREFLPTILSKYGDRRYLSIRCKRCSSPPCITCGKPTSESSRQRAKYQGSGPYCQECRGGPRMAKKRMPCATCGAESTTTSTYNARKRGGKAYCHRPACQRAARLSRNRRNDKQVFCAGTPGVPCEAAPPKRANIPAMISRRSGRPWRCSSCANRMKAPVKRESCRVCGKDATADSGRKYRYFLKKTGMRVGPFCAAHTKRRK